MDLSASGLAFIAAHEGLRLQAYRDVAGVWTIGYGHCPSRSGEEITSDLALTLLREDCAWAAFAVNAATSGAVTTQYQFDAMTSLCFNVGAAGFRLSSVLRDHLLRDHTAAANAFLLWDKAHVDGELVVSDGLHQRRQDERQMYLGV